MFDLSIMIFLPNMPFPKGLVHKLMGFCPTMHLRFDHGNQWENKIDLIASLCTADFADSDRGFKRGTPILQVTNDEFLYVS